MLSRFRLTLGIAAVLAIVGGQARAQYYPGYGAYGWGGWGGGSTVQGDIARGLGFYNIGAGIYNKETAIADSINTDTVIRWNQYMWLSQQEANRREYARMLQRQNLINQTADTIHDRLRYNPTASDIARGDALNAILDQVTDPRIHSSALRMAKDSIRGDMIDDIPFQNASEAVTWSLNQLTAKDANWPPLLRDDEFTEDRKAYQDAIANALEEDEREDGVISPKTLGNLRSIVARLRAKLDLVPPAERKRDYVDAMQYVKTLTGMGKMLQNPSVDKVIAEVQKTPKTTLGSLLGFMHTYNLRFGATKTPEQRAVYERLYAMMAPYRDRVVKESGIEEKPPLARSKGQPGEFFQGMHLDHLDGKGDNTPQPPEPAPSP